MGDVITKRMDGECSLSYSSFNKRRLTHNDNDSGFTFVSPQTQRRSTYLVLHWVVRN